jgi:hypothetical protein
MTDIALTAAQIGVVFPSNCEIIDLIAAEAITKGQAVYQNSSGKAALADADGSGTRQFRGIALKAAAAGQPVSILKRGHVYGFTVSGLNADVPLYLSNTAGALADAGSSGGTTVIAGIVTCLTDKALTKVAYIDAQWSQVWA